MNGSTKILTVSYGTFSCTLEGFDDPFQTMRGIAEYFRDLAADDRYFGAEPPTPDVEMLQSIAEREVNRRVKARIGETGVALTQVAEDAEVSAPEPAPEQPPMPTRAEAPAPKREPQPAPKPAPQPEALDHGPLTLDDEFLMADEPEDVLAVDPGAPRVQSVPAESVAEKLRRIRAVVSRNIEQAEASDSGSFSPAQAPDAVAPIAEPRDRALSDTIARITADLSEVDDAEATVDLTADDSDQPPAGGESDEPDVFADLGEEPAEPAAGAAPGPMDEIAEEKISAETWDSVDLESWELAAEAAPEAAPESEPAPEPVAEAAPEPAPEPVAEATPEPVAAADPSPRPYGPTPEAPQAEAEDEPRRTSKPLGPLGDSGDDLGRLMAETDSKLREGENVRRRRVISQMRAAVAATKADRLFSRRVTSQEAEDAREQSPYRADLSQAIRPLPQDAGDGGAAPQARRTSVAPLVLVSEQRIDVAPKPAPQPEASAAPAPEGFADFVQSTGADGLTELMEAAAAYSSFIEGQPYFSRPEIMRRVMRVDPTLKLSREAGLRSFGQLLRQGKFQKLERGQFTIAESSRFNPGQRIAGE